MAAHDPTIARPGDDRPNSPAPSRRTLLAGAAVLLPASSAIATASSAGTAPPPMTREFAQAWATMQDYLDPSVTDDMGDAEFEAWGERQAAACARLASTPARSVAELARKLEAVIGFMDENQAWFRISEEEGDVLRSCLADAQAMAGEAA